MIPETVMAALTAICPEHARLNPDCGDCGSRQEAAGLYLCTLIDDVAKALKL